MFSIRRTLTSDLNVQIETVERKEKKEAIKIDFLASSKMSLAP